MTTFRQHLDTLSLAEKRAILAAEQRYLRDRRIEHNEAGGAGDPLEQAFRESMVGYADTPAGVAARHVPTPDGLPLFLEAGIRRTDVSRE